MKIPRFGRQDEAVAPLIDSNFEQSGYLAAPVSNVFRLRRFVNVGLNATGRDCR